MNVTISGLAAIFGLFALTMLTRAASILPSEYEFAIGSWLVRPSSFPLWFESDHREGAQLVLALKLALPFLVGLVTYLSGHFLYQPEHDGDRHEALLAGAFSGTFAAALLLAWPVMAHWVELSPIAYLPQREIYLGIYAANVLAVAWLARAGAGLTGLAFYLRPNIGDRLTLRMRISSVMNDLVFGAGLVVVANLTTSLVLNR